MDDARDIFLVCNNFEELGGLQSWVHHIGRLFAARGHRVHLVGITHAEVPHDHGGDYPYRTTVLHPKLPARLRGRCRERTIARGSRLLTELFQSARPGGVVIVAQIWAMEWVAAADTAGLHVVGMSHESYAATRASSRYRRVKRFFADVDVFLTLTADDADAWALDGMSNAAFMPNPMHIEPKDQARLEAPVVVRLGRLSHDKGQDLLLEAWSQVAAVHPDWVLRLYGSGPQEDALKTYARSLGVSGRVEFPGPTVDLESALLGGSIFALTSREEGFPMAILEAMACGVPCVAFDCAPGVRTLITNEIDGLLVPPGNTAGFAAALRRLIEDQGLRWKMGAAAAESVQRFRPDTVLDRWDELFALLEL